MRKYLSIISVLLFLVIWEIAGRFEFIDPVFISYPTKIISEGYYLFASGKIIPHLIISLKILLTGFVSAVVFGMVCGIFIGSSENLYEALKPFIYFLNSLPKVALIPLVIIWFGLGTFSKIIIVFLMAVVPILINTIDGSRSVNKNIISMAKSFNFSKTETVRKISFFSSLPYLFSGMRISSGKAVIGLVIAEVFGYGLGLGHLLSFYGLNFQTSRLMFVVLLFTALNFSLLGLIFLLEKKMLKWKN